jgi:hypothetical protein
MRDDLVQKEFEVTQSIEELRRLDDEIKEWENNHWMLKKNKGYNGPPPPPPSAIV